MATKSLAKVTVDNAGRKRSGFDLGGRLSTSFQFGEVLPVHCRKLVANSSHTVGTRSLVRLDPMVAPTSQGRMTVKMWHSFVGLSDLFRNYSAFITGKTVSGSNGLISFSKLPSMLLCELSSLCLVGARVSVWADPVTNSDGSVSWTRYSDGTTIDNLVNNYIAFSVPNPLLATSDAGTIFAGRFPNYTLTNVNYRYRALDLFGINYSYSTGGEVYLPLGNDSVLGNSRLTLFSGAPEVDIAHCDFVFYNDFTDSSQNTKRFAFAVNMSNYGARFYDILTVLGIGVDFACIEEVDLTRLFAYYLSYYGSFGLSLYTNYESSNCSRFLKAYENGGNSFGLVGVGSGSNATTFGNQWYLNDLFINFITDLCTGYVTEPVDYVSAHRRTDVITNDELGWVHNIVVSQPNLANPDGAFTQYNATYPGTVKASTNAIFINQISHTQVDADLLKMLWKNSNRQSVAGQELEKLLRAGGYGAYVDQQQSHFLGYTEYDVDVSDINATSDSVNTVTGRGSTLGQYVGKGIGAQKDDKTFSYDTDEAGYWITLAAIVPDSSYCQGNDQTVFDVERTDQYQPEMDSMGYELERKFVIKAGADVVNAQVTSHSQDSFGYVPRLMRYKVGRSVLAGNFRRRSTRDQYLPFVLSRWLDVDDLYESAARTSTATSETVTLKYSQPLSFVPIGGNAWRYINLYPWLSNFERIFAFDEKVRGAWETQQKFERYVYCGERYDYFMLFMNIMHKCNAPMLPVSDSWSTTDDNDGNGTTMVQS